MSGVEAIPIGAIAGAASQVAWFLPVLVATIAYFHYEVNDPESRIIDQPGNLLLDQYDFIIVGAGSAGENTILYIFYNIIIPYSYCGIVTVNFQNDIFIICMYKKMLITQVRCWRIG